MYIETFVPPCDFKRYYADDSAFPFNDPFNSTQFRTRGVFASVTLLLLFLLSAFLYNIYTSLPQNWSFEPDCRAVIRTMHQSDPDPRPDLPEPTREHTSTLPEQSTVVLVVFQQLQKETEELRPHSYEQIGKLTERNEALETQLSLLAVSDHLSHRPQSTSSPVPQPRVHTPPVATDAKPIPLPRSKLPQRLSHSAAESFRQDRLQDLEQRLQQLEMISSPTHARPSLHQSFPQRSYDRVDDGRNGYRPT
ncbi:hypothetical protein QQF64_029810 [Cirrhinus molitorella]|uniref:Uncharacterized protein n=1 Tax=Cirrhinus molitorella TaxID=172907 RepID=A0ABR3N1M6_9TELE